LAAAPPAAALIGAAASEPTAAQAAPALDFAELVEAIDRRGHPLAANIMRLQLRSISLEPGLLRYSRPDQFKEDIGAVLRDALRDTTGLRWTLEELPEGGEPTLVERDEAARAEAADRTRAHPLVAAAFTAFPEAELIEDSEAPPPGVRQWRNQA
jgi:DNA polymerase III subunit gamma/tau